MDVAECIWVLFSSITLASLPWFSIIAHIYEIWGFSDPHQQHTPQTWNYSCGNGIYFMGQLPDLVCPTKHFLCARWSARLWGRRAKRHRPCPREAYHLVGEVRPINGSSQYNLVCETTDYQRVSQRFSPQAHMHWNTWGVCYRQLSAPPLPHEYESLGLKLVNLPV